MKVILNKDLSPLGEEGDVKDVAKGYARNYLFPRGIALPYNERTAKLFEGRKEQIETRKAQKRGDAAGLKEKLESLNLEITMPAGANGKLYGAVTSQTIVDELAKHGYQMERKKVELPGNSIKNVGKYKAVVKLYENASAEISVSVLGQEIKTETRKAAPARPARRRREGTSHEESREETSHVDSHEGTSHEEVSHETAGAEAPREPTQEVSGGIEAAAAVANPQ
ncbi:MAG: 50S ribosomal protein L9 [Treponema sp.]|jgi:large subunit ribosomal protein L9|nr:50S ribosomal protein L9 [Treponema sp.]